VPKICQYNNPEQCGRESVHKNRAARGNAMLGDSCGGINTIWETKEIFSEVWEKSAAVDSAEPNSKGILLRLHRRDIFVGARLLSTLDFCGCEILSPKIFVDARFLSMREFC
jgi:hypothetical protein